MAPKKRPVSLKQALSIASREEEEEEEEEDALEMERNFALLSKSGPVQISEMPEKDEEEASEEESDAGNQDDEDTDAEKSSSEVFVKEQRQAERTAMTGTDHSDATTRCKADLSTMSFEEIMRFQSKVGTKACKRLAHEVKKKKQNSEPPKRVIRDGPQEISAKKPVSFLRRAGSVKEPILRDPRFDDLSGEFRPEVFSQTYKFIGDIRQREAQMVKKKLKKVKSDAKKQELKSLLKRMENQKRNHQRQEQQREKELSYKRKQRVLVGDGRKPFYLKKSDQKKLHLAEKYNELKKSGKLENFLSKKRKRNAVKDRRKLP